MGFAMACAQARGKAASRDLLTAVQTASPNNQRPLMRAFSLTPPPPLKTRSCSITHCPSARTSTQVHKCDLPAGSGRRVAGVFQLEVCRLREVVDGNPDRYAHEVLKPKGPVVRAATPDER